MIFSDVIVIGGGLVGSLTAISLSKLDLKVTIVEAYDENKLLDPAFDGRTTAVSFGSKQIFDSLDIWSDLAATAAPINDIKVYEVNSPWAINFDHTLMGNNPMGYIIDNLQLRKALWKHVKQSPNIKVINPVTVSKIWYEDNLAKLKLSNDSELEASLIIGAEGKNSPSRKMLGMEVKTWDYKQTATVATVTHEKPHNHIAWEAFMPDGPLALLPLPNCPKTNAYRSGIVWSQSQQISPLAHELPEEQFGLALAEHFPFYGKISLYGQRWAYPLKAMVAKSFTAERYALVGDSAHHVHPIAGQGVNLGWRDALQLIEILSDANELGLDIGSQTVLKMFERKQRRDIWSIVGFTDAMNRIFSNNSTLLFGLRNAGLGIINQIKPLKFHFMKQAMGLHKNNKILKRA